MFELETDLRLWVEGQVDSVYPEQGHSCRDYRGLPFMTFATGGIKNEGALVLTLCSETSLAVEFFKLKFLQYIKDKPIKYLQWRAYPTIEKVTQHCPFSGQEFTYYHIYSRFSIAGY
jgi:hypothetical protein